ncbi:MAG: hypothetical protein KJ757_07670 [Planctomycetes bacterium]|nr:hypothetical protein [Planctomycetota bacterium]MBU1517402.1 hypothetical protein [Planctomycetota bacterium]MBU2457762.1 hypothetical protein [Planctomycetota bacterium]MBU2597419.1 hypothetical protein [Planctomycetota bacterium]
MNFFQKLFLEKELKEVLAVLVQVEAELKKFDYPIIKKSVEQCIFVSLKGRTKKVLEVNKATPEMMVYSIIANVAADYLGSGRYHVYRGVLDFSGQNLYSILNICLKKLESTGFTFGGQSVAGFRLVVNEDIKGAG